MPYTLTGRYSDGQFQINISDNADYNRLKSIITLGFAPSYLLDMDIEFTPVDCCSRAIVKLSKLYESRGKVFHVYNHNELNGRELITISTDLGYPVEPIENQEFLEYIKTVSVDKDKQGVLDGLIIEFNNNRELQYNSSITLDSSITQEYLRQVGFIWPMIDREYLSKAIKYMKDVDFIY